MIRHVLVCVDGTKASERSIPWVRLLTGPSKVTLLRVMESVVVPPAVSRDLRDAGTGVPIADLSIEDCVELARRDLETLAKNFTPAARVIVRCFIPAAKAIAEAARAEEVDMIALTTTGGSKLGRRVFGGTTERLMHTAEVPLLVVPAGPAKAPPADGIRRIVVPLDGSDASEQILPLAKWIAQRNDAVATFAHVATNADDETRYAYFEGHLRRVTELWERQWIRAKIVLRRGAVIENLRDVVGAADADLVVMSSHGHGVMRRTLFGSVASEFIRESAVPVVVARQEALAKLRVEETAGVP